MANLRDIFVRYRESIFYISLILLCFAAIYAIAWNRKNQTSIYYLAWQDSTDANNVVHHMWWYYLKPSSNLPYRIDKYSRVDPNDSYTLQEYSLIDYPTDDQVRQIVKDAGFGDLPEDRFKDDSLSNLPDHNKGAIFGNLPKHNFDLKGIYKWQKVIKR